MSTAYLDHHEKSRYCYKNYPVLMNAKGRDVCPCGWHEPTRSQGEEEAPPRGVRFSELRQPKHPFR